MTESEERLYEFLEEYKELLNENKLDELYNKLITVQGISNHKLTEVLYSAGIPVLSYLTYIPENYNSYDVKLITVNIPKNIKYVADYAYFRCKNLRALDFEKDSQCVLIQDSAFAECSMLSSIRFAEGLKTIEPYAFSECRSLNTVVLPNSLCDLMSKAFLGCANLTRVYTGLNLESIDNDAFNSCRKLEYIKIDNPKIHLGERVFIGCDNLSTIDFNGSKLDWQSVVSNADDHCSTWLNRPYTVTRVHCNDGDVHIDGTNFE